MDDISKAVRAIDDMNKVSAAPVRLPVIYNVAQSKAADLDGNPYPDGVTPAVPDGWMALKTAEGYRLVRGRDRQSLQGSANPNLWSKQIFDFEFAEGTEWTDEQIKAMVGASGGGKSANAGAVLVVGLDMASGSDWTCYRPWLPAGAEIPVTPEMIDAGAIERTRHNDRMEKWLARVYRAMASLAPVELVSPGELAAVRERDEALAKIERLKIDRNQQSEIRNDQKTEIAMLRQALAMKDARIAQLALTPVAFEDFDDAPEKPEHNPFRDFGHDPRRMGP